MFAFKYRPEVHEIRDVPQASFVRRRFKNPDLFVYYHREAGNWSVGEWMPGERWEMLEDVKVIGPTLDGFDADLVEVIDYILRGPSANPRDEVNKRNRDKERREQEKQDWDLECWATQTFAPLHIREHSMFKRPKLFGTS